MDFPERIDTHHANAPFAEIVMHENRYLLAKKEIAKAAKNGFSILDAGCGTGYGSLMLSELPSSTVLGVDIDAESVKSNQAKYKNQKNLQFDKCDLIYFKPKANSYDFITCFEVIEHIDEESGNKLMKNFYEMLSPGGLLFISSPNFQMSKFFYKTKISSPNPFHLHEYEVSELQYSLKKTGYKVKKTYGQFLFFPPLYFLSSPNLRLDSYFKPYSWLPKYLSRYFMIVAEKA